MPDQLPRKSKTSAQEVFETLAFCWRGTTIAAFFGWQYKVPGLYPLVQWINDSLSSYTLPLFQRTFGPNSGSTRQIRYWRGFCRCGAASKDKPQADIFYRPKIACA
jgi:hypothetical protein